MEEDDVFYMLYTLSHKNQCTNLTALFGIPLL